MMWTGERVLTELASILSDGGEISGERSHLIDAFAALHPKEQGHLMAHACHPDLAARMLANGIASRLNLDQATSFPSEASPSGSSCLTPDRLHPSHTLRP